MTTMDGAPAPDALRELVREVLRDILPTLADRTGSPPPIAPLMPSVVPAAPFMPSVVPVAPFMPSVVPAAPRAPSVIPAVPPAPPTSDPAPSRPAAPAPDAAAGGNGRADGRRSDGTLHPVRLATNEDVHEFVLQIIRLADNPKRRRDLLAGRLRFTLAPTGPTLAPAAWPANGRSPQTPADHGRAGTSQADHRIEKGAVTERAVQAAASAGARLVLGPRAVLTPLARDRARALGVPIEKER
ncbi:MAG TPA: hypothetical protein VH307_26200 [Streptosporangiaceae bacterium]|nr:hypothetical protein [Streptosporangiaceae bacterium]